MAQIDDLKKSITDMSKEELLSLLSDVRKSRRTSKPKQAKKTNDVASLLKMAKKLTPAELAELLKED